MLQALPTKIPPQADVDQPREQLRNPTRHSNSASRASQIPLLVQVRQVAIRVRLSRPV
jgi:hypothetical protein